MRPWKAAESQTKIPEKKAIVHLCICGNSNWVTCLHASTHWRRSRRIFSRCSGESFGWPMMINIWRSKATCPFSSEIICIGKPAEKAILLISAFSMQSLKSSVKPSFESRIRFLSRKISKILHKMCYTFNELDHNCIWLKAVPPTDESIHHWCSIRWSPFVIILCGFRLIGAYLWPRDWMEPRLKQFWASLRTEKSIVCCLQSVFGFHDRATEFPDAYHSGNWDSTARSRLVCWSLFVDCTH